MGGVDLTKPITVAPVGTGPFKFVAADPNRSAIFERHETYWRRGFPYLDRLEIHNREGQQEAAGQHGHPAADPAGGVVLNLCFCAVFLNLNNEGGCVSEL